MIRFLLSLSALAFLAGCAEWKMLNAETMTPETATASTLRERVVAEPTAWQTETFGSLTRFVGRTFRGEPLEASSEANADIQSWDWALGGAGLSIRHALEDGSYGGETLIYHDNAADALAYVYVTNAGFRTEGIFLLEEDGSWQAEEDVSGHDTITKVRSTGRERLDGTLLSTSEYFKDGTWTPGHEFLYREVFDMSPDLKTPTTKP